MATARSGAVQMTDRRPNSSELIGQTVDGFVFLKEIVNVVTAQGLTFDRADDALEEAGFS